MPPRYFIGLSLPNNITENISQVQNQIYNENLYLKPLLPHITIIAPNNLERVSPFWLIPKLKQIQTNLMPINIKLVSFGMFHSSNLHIKVESDNIIELYNQCLSLLPKVTISKHLVGKWQFNPHITIVQTKPKLILNQDKIELYKYHLQALIGQEFAINHLTKFEHTAPRQYQIKSI